MSQKRFQVYEVTPAENHAGSKATRDASRIAGRLQYRMLEIPIRENHGNVLLKAWNQLLYARAWARCASRITPDAYVLMQFPFHYRQLGRGRALKKIKQRKAKVIALVHDVEELREYRFNRYYLEEFRTMLRTADVFIVHNEAMKAFFLTRGVPIDKIVTLNLFDYLRTGKDLPEKFFRRTLIVAGNLDPKKCGYVKELCQMQDVEVDLYGPGYVEAKNQGAGIHYQGVVPADELPGVLNGGFGLVWDGNTTETCSGSSGQYLRFNNPHKLSLYLASGLPVVIWEKAAEAGFVKKNGVGLCVSSVEEAAKAIREITEKEYEAMLGRVRNVQIKLTDGAYLKQAIASAEKILGE